MEETPWGFESLLPHQVKRNKMAVAVRRFLFSSLALWIAVTLVGAYFLLHVRKFINLGVDLVGGTYITLKVQTEKAVESELAHKAQSLVSILKSNNQPAPDSVTVTLHEASLNFPNEDTARKAENFLISQELGGRFARESTALKVRLTKEEKLAIEREAVEGNMRILERRLNPYGAEEVSIIKQGERNIIIELPNVHDTQQAKAMIGKTALLEIKLVEDVGRSPEDLLKRHGGKIPEDMVIAKGQERGGDGLYYYLVPKYTDLTGRLLKDAVADVGGELGTTPTVKIRFNAEGADKFYDITSKNIGRSAAILLDNVVITAPRINSAIRESGEISGSMTMHDAQNLATLLNAGAFTAPVSFEQELHIGPSLGYESIRSGLMACAIGLGALLIFAVAIYKMSGLLAFIVLLYNILLILFGFYWLKATLTLPGIAGMILTVGMAIDASILIYERIKEELAAGLPFRKAVDEGFSGALAVILDANITHFIVAVVLYKFGAGPIRGFAIAMIVGIVSTLITGILLLKSLFKLLLDGLGFKRISI